MKKFDADLRRSFRSIRGRQVGMGIFFLLFIAMNTLMIQQLQQFIDLVVAGNYDVIPYSLIRIGGVLIALLISMFTYQYNFQILGQVGSFSLIDFLFGKTLRQSLSFHQRISSGVVASKIMNDSKYISDWCGHGIVVLIGQGVQLAVTLAMLFYYSVPITLATIALLGICFYFVNIISGRLGTWMGINQKLTAEVQQRILQSHNGIREIVQNQKEEYFHNKAKKTLYEEKLPVARRIGMLQSLYFCLALTMMIVIPVVAVGIGVVFLSRGVLSLGSLLAIYAFTGQLQEPIRTVSQAVATRKQALVMQDRVADLYRNPIIDARQKVDLPSLNDLRIWCHDFGFDENRPLLKDIKVNLTKGNTLVVKGPSGSGKSTLGNLILRFIDAKPDNFRMLWNGVDIREYKHSAYFGKALQAQQKPFVFEGTLRENLELGDAFTEIELEEVLYTAALDDLVKAKGIEYLISENGTNLSGGQIQRIGIARTLLRKPELMVLDEPTSALNEEMGRAVSRRIQTFAKKYGMTLIVISHKDDFDEGNSILLLDQP